MDTPRDPNLQTATSIEESHGLALSGDFQRARRVLEQARATVPAPDAERLAAAQRSFRLDRAALAVVVLTALGLIAVIALTLFH
jgi:hypothetical protein